MPSPSILPAHPILKTLTNTTNSNQANLQMIEHMGIYPDRTIREKRPTLRAVAQMVIATIRMRRRKEAWEVNKEMQTQLAKTLERQRRRGSGRVKELVV